MASLELKIGQRVTVIDPYGVDTESGVVRAILDDGRVEVGFDGGVSVAVNRDDIEAD